MGNRSVAGKKDVPYYLNKKNLRKNPKIFFIYFYASIYKFLLYLSFIYFC